MMQDLLESIRSDVSRLASIQDVVNERCRAHREATDRILTRLEKHDAAIYGSNGNPGLLSAAAEIRRLSARLWTLATIVIGGLITLVGGLCTVIIWPAVLNALTK